MRRFFLILILTVWSVVSSVARDTGAAVVLIYNTRLPESKGVAEYYAARRQVPTNQILGLELPTTETMTRLEYHDQLHAPIRKWLEAQNFLAFKSVTITPTNGNSFHRWRVTQAKIKYVLLCYGVPSRILRDPSINEPGSEKLPAEYRRNEAAVDTELALLPMDDFKLPLTGPLQNFAYGVTNNAWLNPTNGVLLVTRLDGPTPEIARGLVDKAMEAETNGFWGRAYFDLRGVTNEYKLGDDWIAQAADISRHYGMETVVDDKPETFSASFPMSQIGLYVGWYDGDVSGPFRRPTVEFMPGAIAYHLHSFSAASIRTATKHWVGPLLAKGATATLGCVEEPYLTGTPDVGALVSRLLFFGFDFGEACYAALPVLSWQTTIIGDPLYLPTLKPPQILHQELLARKSKLIEWSHLRVVNLNLALRYPLAEVVGYLENEATTAESSILQEKLGELYQAQGKPESSIHCYQEALKLKPTPQQTVRLTLALAEKLIAEDKSAEAYELYRQFLKTAADYPDRIGIYRKLANLATKLNKAEDAENFQKEIQRLSAPPAAGN